MRNNPKKKNHVSVSPYEERMEEELKTEKDSKRLLRRTQVLVMFFSVAILVYFAILFNAQIVQGEDIPIVNIVHRTSLELERVRSVRGELLDSKGRVLITNTVSYHVELEPREMGERRNAILDELLTLCQEEGVEWAEALPISETAPWTYTTEEPLRYRAENTWERTNFGILAEKCGWVDNARTAPPTAEDLLATMCVDFGLIEKGEPVDNGDRQMAGVLYALYLRLRQVVYYDYIFARDVDLTFIAKARERSLDGVNFVMDTGREYKSSWAAHILGRTGSIPRDQTESYTAKGYPLDAEVGLDGAELAFEDWLRGTEGELQTVWEDTGAMLSREWKDGIEPEAGKNVMLTLDMDLQAEVETRLAETSTQIEGTTGLAAVVIDMTGGVLAMGSWPTYDLSTYLENYTELTTTAPNNPLLNRAAMGLYSPGSTFKMVTATAALHEKTIGIYDVVRCTGIYRYYPDVQPACWAWNSYRGTHGTETVSEAITDSCNIFFYDVGRRVGIDKIDEFAAAYGLGQPTGIEIPEYVGNVAGPATAEKYGQTWYPGLTMFAAIGQENHQFTPLQLANYVATLANGGDHYKAHLLKNVLSADYSSVVYQYEPEILNHVDLDDASRAAIKKGMTDLAKTRSMAADLGELPVQIACKTGTAEVAQSAANAVFVCYAPADNPEIALCLVAEKGASGSALAVLAGNILRAYFNNKGTSAAVPGENELVR